MMMTVFMTMSVTVTVAMAVIIVGIVAGVIARALGPCVNYLVRIRMVRVPVIVVVAMRHSLDASLVPVVWRRERASMATLLTVPLRSTLKLGYGLQLLILLHSQVLIALDFIGVKSALSFELSHVPSFHLVLPTTWLLYLLLLLLLQLRH